MAHMERVFMSEMGGVIGVRNAAILPSTATVASNCLCLLPGGLLRLYALRLRVLCTLRLCFLCVLWRCFLRTLWLRLLRLYLLCVLRLLLVLRRLGFSSAFLLLLFLCKCRKGGSEQYKHHCCADDSIVFHKCGLPTHFSSASH